jgi:hypothetical protein
MENIESLIQGSEKLTSIFGYWPSFHDAEIIDLHFWRGVVEPDQGRYDFPVLTLRIHESFSFSSITHLQRFDFVMSMSSEWKGSITRMRFLGSRLRTSSERKALCLTSLCIWSLHLVWARHSVASVSRSWTPFRAVRSVNRLRRIMTLLSVR